MIDFSQLSLIEVILLAFAPTAIAATQLHTKGIVGWMAIATILLICFTTVLNLEGMKMAAGFMSALAGLAAGGKISDTFKLKRLNQQQEIEKRQRDARTR